jgi:hypothetical protein
LDDDAFMLVAGLNESMESSEFGESVTIESRGFFEN